MPLARMLPRVLGPTGPTKRCQELWPQQRRYTFRATGITAYLEAGGTLENAQLMAAHESPRTTKLYDRTGDENHAR
jgi:hypothetical protein